MTAQSTCIASEVQKKAILRTEKKKKWARKKKRHWVEEARRKERRWRLMEKLIFSIKNC